MIDPKDVVGILQSLITWSCFFIALAIFKRLLSYGLAIAFAEILKISGEETRERMAKWFVNGEDILHFYREQDERVELQKSKRAA